MGPTTARTIAQSALVGLLAGWLLVVVTSALDVQAPEVPWTAPVGLVVIASLVGVLAYGTHQRIHVRHERVEPQRAVTYLLLGKASALAGALVAGGYLAFALMFITRLDAPDPRDRVIRGLTSVVAAVGLAVTGLLLERACRVPRSDADDNDVDADTGE